jgi:hypothetical protein
MKKKDNKKQEPDRPRLSHRDVDQEVDRMLRNQHSQGLVIVEPGRGRCGQGRAAVPVKVWRKLVAAARRHGYSFAEEDGPRTLISTEAVMFGNALRKAEEAVEWTDDEYALLKQIRGVLFQGQGLFVTRR